MSLTNQSQRPKSLNSLMANLLLMGIVGTTLLSLVGHVGWNIFLELLSHFKLQYLIISLLLWVLLVIIKIQRHLILIGLFCVVINLTEILSFYVPTGGLTDTAAGNIRVLSSNLNINNKDYSKILSFVREERPDIAIFIEVNEAGDKQLSSLSDILPYSVGVGDNSEHLEVAVYSKQPLGNKSGDFLMNSKNSTIIGDIKINGQVISLIATHPAPPFPPDLFPDRNKHLDEISQYVQHLKNPVVMAGDLNITMWSPYYKKFVSQTKLHNARQGFGILPSWPNHAPYTNYAKIPPFLAWLLSIPIDHCLISPGIKVSNIRTGPNVDSDHLPLITDLVIPKQK